MGLTICEDIWEPGPPATSEALAGAQVIVNLSASPYHAGKPLERETMLVQRARDSIAIVAFCNLVGGQDELVFDGHSVAIDHEGTVLARAPEFEESLTICTVDPGAVEAGRLRDARHRAAARRERARGGDRARARRVAAGARGRRASTRRSARRAARARRGDLPGARARPARLRRQERLQAGRLRPLGRHRLDARRADRGRRARARARGRRRHAVPLLVERDPVRRARARRQPRHRALRVRDLAL